MTNNLWRLTQQLRIITFDYALLALDYFLRKPEAVAVGAVSPTKGDNSGLPGAILPGMTTEVKLISICFSHRRIIVTKNSYVRQNYTDYSSNECKTKPF